ncbi:MAG: hypothetical protein IKP95_05285 [Ruminococcus sp.]|nr:hypothetical protein [Ruminococcus sp.]
MIKSVLTVAASLLLLAGCAEVPENVRERDSKLEQTEQAQDQIELERGSLDLIRSRLEEDASKKYGTITVDHASAGTASEMPVYSIEACGGDYTVKELARYLYGDRYDLEDESVYEFLPWDYEGSELKKNTDKYTPEIDLLPHGVYCDVWSCYPAEDSTCSAHVFSDGSCWGSQTGLSKYGNDYDAMWLGSIKEHWYPEYDDISAVSYKMYDGTEWALEDAVSFTEELWNSELSKNDPQKYKYKVRRVEVVELPSNNNYGYLFMMSYEDEQGACYDCDSYDDFALMESRAYEGKRFFIGQSLWQLSLRKDEITRFDKHFSFCIKEALSNDSRLLTLGAALTELQNKLAENINLAFETAELCYIVTCDKYPDKDYGGTVKYSPSFALKYCTFQLRPYWCFRRTNGFIDNWSNTENYYVDAVTGEIVHIKLGL